MLDVADVLLARGVRYAVVGAMAAAVHGVVRASLDADAVVAMQVREAGALQRTFAEAGFLVELRVGDSDDPIAALLAIRDTHGNRVDLLIGLRGLDPDALARTRQVPLLGAVLQIIGLEDFVAMKAFAGGPVDLADAAAVLSQNRGAIDVKLLRSLAAKFSRDTAKMLEQLLADAG